MATVTGNLAQITGSPLTGLEPRLYVLTPDNFVYSSSVVVTRPAPVTPDSSGNFSVNLIPSVLAKPLIDYSLKIEWLDSSGTPLASEYPRFTFRVPIEGGLITDLMATRPSAYQVYPSTVPVTAALLREYPILIRLNPESGDMFQVEEN